MKQTLALIAASLALALPAPAHADALRDAVQADLSAGRIADAKSLAVLGFYLLGLLPP